MINKDPEREWSVALRFVGPKSNSTVPLPGPAHLYQFSEAQYRWQANGERGRPLRSQTPQHTALPGREPMSIRLPPWSLTVARGQGPQFSESSQEAPQ